MLKKSVFQPPALKTVSATRRCWHSSAATHFLISASLLFQTGFFRMQTAGFFNPAVDSTKIAEICGR
jgi:hypothetical protein